MSIDSVEPQSLALLMSKQPSTMTDEDVERLVIILREARSKFDVTEKAASSAKKSKASDTLSLEDLDL